MELISLVISQNTFDVELAKNSIKITNLTITNNNNRFGGKTSFAQHLRITTGRTNDVHPNHW